MWLTNQRDWMKSHHDAFVSTLKPSGKDAEEARQAFQFGNSAEEIELKIWPDLGIHY